MTKWISVLFLTALVVTGCSRIPQTILTGPSGATLSQIDNVEKPAVVKSNSGSFEIPAGSTVIAREDVLEFQLQTQSVFNFSNEELTGAETVAPPSAGALAAASGIRYMFFAGIAAILGGIALFGFAHTQSGLWISAGGGCLIVAAKVVSMPIFGYLAIGCLAAGVAFFAAWYILKGRDDEDLAKQGLIKPSNG